MRTVTELFESVQSRYPLTVADFPLEAGTPLAQQFVPLSVYDVLGREIGVLVNEAKPSGSFEVSWNGANFPSGVYYYTLRAGNIVETRKMVLMK